MLVLAAIGLPAAAAAAPAPTTALTDLAPFPERVHVAKVGAAGLTADAMTTADSTREVERWDEQVVIERRKDAVRIAVDDGDARMFLWIATTDLEWTVARPTRLRGRGAAGVWALPGAALAIAGRGARVVATYDDGNVVVRGAIARRALTQVFRATRPPASGTHTATGPLRGDPGGPALLTTTHPLDVSPIARGAGEWQLVEHRGRYLRVVGWVRGAELSTDLIGFGTIGSGGSFGMNHTPRIEVPAGACLFDPASGVVAGIQLQRGERFVADQTAAGVTVYVGNAWGIRQLVVRDLAGGRGAPRWARCD